MYKRFPIEIVRGEGARLFDADGRSYLDFTSGIGVNALGYGDAGIASRGARCAREWRAAHVESLSHGAGAGARGGAGRAVVRVERVLLQLGRGGERGRVQVRAAVGARRRRRRQARDRGAARRISRAPVRDARGDGPSAVSRAVSPARGRHLDRRAGHRRALAHAGSANGCGGDRRAGAGRGRRARARAGVPERAARAHARAARRADLRRGAVRARSHGMAVRVRARGCRAGCRDAREAAGGRAANGCGAHVAGDRGVGAAGRSRDDVRRRSVRRGGGEARVRPAVGSGAARARARERRVARRVAARARAAARRRFARCVARDICGGST